MLEAPTLVECLGGFRDFGTAPAHQGGDQKAENKNPDVGAPRKSTGIDICFSMFCTSSTTVNANVNDQVNVNGV